MRHGLVKSEGLVVVFKFAQALLLYLVSCSIG